MPDHRSMKKRCQLPSQLASISAARGRSAGSSLEQRVVIEPFTDRCEKMQPEDLIRRLCDHLSEETTL